MCSYIPVMLQGANLGERHRYLNSLVCQAFAANVSIKEIITIPEKSSIDRIFKIDLASKYRYVEYILQNLKDDDMLYVSRCLKCRWLLEPDYRDIICPLHLNDVLYPEMIQPAVNKMKHWLQINLKDAERCQEFYNYYKSNIEDAIIFFWHCSNEFILSEFPNIVDKLTPVQMRILIENCPSACTLYFEILPSNRPALTRYVNDELNYFNCIKHLLKYNGNSFLDLVEKYFNTSKFDPFGPSTTEFVMKNYKNRVLTKAELYFSSILHKKTFAAHLTNDEAREIILQLARAEYLSNWFSYQNVEPLVKRVKISERALLKKQVFVEKTIGSTVAEWPYPIPKPLSLGSESDKFLLDVHHKPHEYKFHKVCKRLIKKKKCSKYCAYDIVSVEKSLLDKLFNRYRFTGFEATFRELSKKLLAETTIEGRMNMMLVLVSKSGGISEQIEKLLNFLVDKHKNETNTLRAAVIRSLVKRERVWAVEDKAWEYFLEFGRDLGLDGSNAELVCREGLHAVIIRHLLHDTPVSETLLAGFLRDFSKLSEYKLNVAEKTLIAKRLPSLLISSNPIAFLDVIGEYKLSIKDFPDAVPFLVKAANDDPNLVCRLFDAKMLRRELFHKSFTLKQTNAMYLNALRHDVHPLECGKSFTSLASSRRPNHDKFLQTLSLFFSEPGGLAEQHRNSLEEVLAVEPKSWFVRPLCMLWSTELVLKRISDLSTKEKGKDEMKSKILSELKSNVHKSKPTLNIDVIDWQTVGAKAIANKVFICRTKDQERYLMKLSESKRTAKISLTLSTNTPFAVDNYLHVYTLRRSAALDFGFSFFFKKTIINESVWTVMKSLIENTKNLSNKRHLLQKIEDNTAVPKNIECDYWVFVYNTFLKIDYKRAMPILCRLENLLPQVDQTIMKNIVNDFIDNDLNVDKFVKRNEINNILNESNDEVKYFLYADVLC
ncbi:unnamed protein product [Euphydryas editha]|uniref:Uncharacterized protein n=1 Tax=Euphydryas editha TaxID=104508 RepID=A0AAU9UHD2_EUPED|nr:unnamed protein product [Euphydryas editha]